MSVTPPRVGTYHALFNDVVSGILKSAGTPGVPLTHHVARGLLLAFPPPSRLSVWQLSIHLRRSGAEVETVLAEVAGATSQGGSKFVEMEPAEVEARWRSRGAPTDDRARPLLLPNTDAPDCLVLSTAHDVDTGPAVGVPEIAPPTASRGARREDTREPPSSVPLLAVTLPLPPVVTVVRQLWILVEIPQAEADAEEIRRVRDTLCSMSVYFQGQTQLLNALRALRAVRQQADLARRVAALTSRADTGRLDQLQATRLLLGEILLERTGEGLAAGYSDLAEQLGVWTLQQLVSVQQGVRAIGGRQATATVAAVARKLGALASPGEPRSTVPTRPLLEQHGRQIRLECLAVAIGALADPLHTSLPAGLGPSAGPEELAWGLLARWTRLHELLRAMGDRRWTPDLEREWRMASEEARAQLGRVLTERRSASGGPSRIGEPFRAEGVHARNWLRLWFVHQLLRYGRAPPQGQADRKLLVALAYVMREGLRFLLFGRLKEFRFQPSVMADAMRTLVQVHATLVAGLPAGLGLADLLHRVGEPHDADEFAYAAGHLQHVLELYVAGHFLGSVDLDAPGHPLHGWSLREVLARRGESQDRPSPEAVSRFMQAFSLAVLTHDVGMDLVPRRGPRTDLTHRHQVLDDWLRAGPQGAMREIARRLIDKAAGDLQRHGYADLSADQALGAWVKEQQDRGVPDHGLVGAWLVHHLCEGVPGLDAGIVRDAVRAVLYHGTPGQVIGADLDPVAALLVVCDELFEWLPNTQRVPSPGSTQRAPSSGADPQVTISRARRVIIRNLRVQMGPRGVTGTMMLPTPSPEEESPTDPGGALRRPFAAAELLGPIAWPHFELVLHHPELLDQPVYATWLTLSQNIRRISPSRAGWRFALTVTSRIPADFVDLEVNTRDVLDRVAESGQLVHAVHAGLTDWIGSVRYEPNLPVHVEAITVVAEGRPLHGPDLRSHLGDIDAVVNGVLARLERARREDD